jgi:hypothetical protein
MSAKPAPLTPAEEARLRNTPSDCWTVIEEKLVWRTVDAARAARDAAEKETALRIADLLEETADDVIRGWGDQAATSSDERVISALRGAAKQIREGGTR